MRLFQKTAITIFLLFMGTMIFVTASCFMRKSGNTGMDMSTMRQVRAEANRP